MPRAHSKSITTTDATTAELRAAFRRSGLWRSGWDFAKAISVATVRWSLLHAAVAARKSDSPTQGSLI